MNTSWLSASVLLLCHKSYSTKSFRKSLGIITAFTCDVPRNRPAGHNVCKTANCQQDFTLLLKSEVCNYFNFIPLLFSSKRHFFGNRKKKNLHNQSYLGLSIHVSRKPPPVFNFISNYMTTNITKL